MSCSLISPSLVRMPHASLAAKASTRDLLNTLDTASQRAGFRSLGDVWADTTTTHGEQHQVSGGEGALKGRLTS